MNLKQKPGLVWAMFAEWLINNPNGVNSVWVGPVLTRVVVGFVPVCPGCQAVDLFVFPCGHLRTAQVRRIDIKSSSRLGGLVAMPCCGWTGLIHGTYGVRPPEAELRLSGRSVEFSRS